MARQSQQNPSSKDQVEDQKEDTAKPEATPPAAIEKKDNVGGFIGTIMRMLTGGDKKKAQTVLGFGSSLASPPSSLPTKGSGEGVTKRSRGFSNDSSSPEHPSTSSPSSTSSSSPSPSADASNMFLHGAVMLILHGNVKMDTITSMGYRSPSDRLFKVESLGRPHEIVTVAADLSLDGGKGTTSQFIQLMSGDIGLVDDSDSDDEEEKKPGNEIQAIIAVVDMIEGLGEDFGGNL